MLSMHIIIVVQPIASNFKSINCNIIHLRNMDKIKEGSKFRSISITDDKRGMANILHATLRY